jgi:hypothetical protein
MAGLIRKIIRELKFFRTLPYRAESQFALLAKMYREPILAAEKAADPKTITAYGFSAYSMTEEDGILQEIFRRIGPGNREFIDIGAGNGIESNTTYLLLLGWTGLWLDGSESEVAIARNNFADQIQSGALEVRQAFITRDNINQLISSAKIIGPEPDLLSIDIDGNDYWIWDALTVVRPRVVLIEYNATFRPPHKVVQEYNPQHRWNSTSYYGASLKALEALGEQKGYHLVGCNFAGVNAFFVRKDVAGDLFSAPYTAEHHYREPFHDAFVRGYMRHPSGVGRYKIL